MKFSTLALTLLTQVISLFTPFMASAATPVFTTLHEFTGYNLGLNDGIQPIYGVVIGPGGVLYGVTEFGGALDDMGTAFSLTPPLSPNGSWIEAVYDFPGGSGGQNPEDLGGLAGRDGALYGTTSTGGNAQAGTVFSLTPPPYPGGPAAQETVLYSFTGGSDGAFPYAGVAIGSGGILYGTTYSGGSSGYGVVFALTPPATPAGPWTETVLHSFRGWDGAHPYGGVVIGDGPEGHPALFGTTEYGGAGSCQSHGCGTVFSLSPPKSPGGPWTETVLHNFQGLDGEYPKATVALGVDGVLYGTTPVGGASGYGTVFALARPGFLGRHWTARVLHSFTGGSDGLTPYAGVTLGRHGVIYGATYLGGTLNGGTIFCLTVPSGPGASLVKTVLYNFSGGSDGSGPAGTLAIGDGGVLYGTTAYGGSYGCFGIGCGTVFALVP